MIRGEEMLRRLRTFALSEEFIIHIMTKGSKESFECIEGLPIDAEIRNVFYNSQFRELMVVAEHPSFDEVHPGASPESYSPVFLRL